jgi:hypothetical protein
MRVVSRQHRADGADGGVELVGDVAIGALQPARFHQRAIKLIRQPGPVGAKRLNAGGQLILVAIRLTAALDRTFQSIQRAINRRVAESISAAPPLAGSEAVRWAGRSIILGYAGPWV